jgi:hypothetical protein
MFGLLPDEALFDTLCLVCESEWLFGSTRWLTLDSTDLSSVSSRRTLHGTPAAGAFCEDQQREQNNPAAKMAWVQPC